MNAAELSAEGEGATEPTTDQDQDRAGAHQIFGRFVVGDHTFAVAAHMLGQVVPIQSLSPLPGAGPEVLGAIHVRGIVTPVLDVLRLCGLPPRDGRPHAALAIRRGEQVMALGIDQVAGLVKISRDEVQDLSDSAAEATARKLLVEGTRFATILDADRFFDRGDLPRTNRQRGGHRRGSNPKGAEPHLTFLCGGVHYAIAVGKLFNTVPRRGLEARDLANVLFSGMLDYLGRSIPVVNTNKVLSLPETDTAAEREVVVVHANKQRLLGLAVDEILHIDYFQTNRIRPIPAHLRTAIPWVRATLDAKPTSETGPRDDNTQTLILDVGAITAMPQLDELANMSVQSSDPTPEEGPTPKGAFIKEPERNLIFMAGDQFGAPISNILHIASPPDMVVPWQAPVRGLKGFFFYENQMLPFVDLGEYLGASTYSGLAEPRVVVSGEGDTRCGFLVDRVLAVVQSDWRTEAATTDHGEDAILHVPGFAGGELLSRVDLGEQTQKITKILA